MTNVHCHPHVKIGVCVCHSVYVRLISDCQSAAALKIQNLWKVLPLEKNIFTPPIVVLNVVACSFVQNATLVSESLKVISWGSSCGGNQVI